MAQEFRGQSLGIFVGIIIVATALTIWGTYYVLTAAVVICTARTRSTSRAP